MKQSNDGSPTSTQACLLVGVGVGFESFDLARRIVEELVAQPVPVAVLVSVAGMAVLDSPEGWLKLERDSPVAILPGSAHIADAGLAIEIRDHQAVAIELSTEAAAAPIDHLFGSLADRVGEMAVGIVMSGNGTDGTLGLRSISDAGGMTIAQAIETAGERSMPQSAAAIGVVDHVLSPEHIAGEILNHAQHMQEVDDSDSAGELNRQIIVAIPQIASAVEKHTQNDFKHYKTTTLARRIRRRIHVLKLPSVNAYIELLHASRDEALQLFRDLLISVTAFFRDPKAFESLADLLLTPLVDQHQGDGPIRIWVPGCATGQEAYSIAMLMTEVVERSGRPITFQIFATDLDERGLTIARAGGYPVGIQDEVSHQRLEKFFTKRGNRFFVSKKIRDSIVFSAHNLISDPPFTKLDLVSCRNLLIYLGSHLQKKLIPLFHYAIKPGGFLFLGPAETLSVNKELFKTLHQKHRFFQRRVTALDAPPMLDMPLVNLIRFSQSSETEAAGEFDLFRYAQQIILGEFSPQWAVIDDEGEIQSLSSDPAPFLQMTAGKFKNNVIAMAHENIRIGLRAAFAEAKRHRRRSLAQDMSISVDGGLQRVHITIQPMPEMGLDSSLHLVAFHRIGTPLQIDDSRETEPTVEATTIADRTAARVIEQLELELSRTREALERTVQELESSNEELKSSNEELLSMNEEMQSANEELETSKEELQTSNEQLIRSNNDVQNLLRSTRIATVFLDSELKIRGFTPAIREIYDLQESDVGRPLAMFVPQTGQLPDLPDPASMNDDDVVEDKVIARNQRTFLRRVIPYRTDGGDNDGVVVTFSDVTELSDSQELFKSLIDASAQIVWTTTADGKVVDDSPSWREFTGQTLEQWLDDGWLNAVHPDDQESTFVDWRSCMKTGSDFSREFRLRHRGVGYRWVQVRGVPQRRSDGSIRRWVGMNVDIHDRKLAEDNLHKSEALTRTMAENSTQALFMMDDRGYMTYCNQAALDMLGFDREELQSKPLHDVIHHHYPDGRPYPMSDCPIDRALPDDFSVRAHKDLFFRKDGSSFPVLCAASPIFDNGKPVSTVIEVRDITQQKEFEQGLYDREAYLRRVLNGSNTFIGVVDLQGRLVEVNEPALNVSGVFREDVIGQPFAETYWWSHDRATEDQIREAIRRAISGQTFRRPMQYRIADGSTRWVDLSVSPVYDENGQVAFVVPSGSDITERYEGEQSLRQTTEQLAAAQEKLNKAMQVGKVAAWGWDTETQRLKSDGAIQQMFGFPVDQSPTIEQYVSRIDASYADAVRAAVEATTKREEPFDIEYPVNLPDGTIRWVHARGGAVVDGDGTTIDFSGFVVDITDRHEIEQQLRAARIAAEAANASKSAFLANMSHEIRTPMTAILGYADLLRDHIESDEAVSHLATIRRNGGYLLEIINDILDLSKIEAGAFELDRERFNVTKVVEDVRSIMGVRANENNLSLDVNYVGKLPSLIESDSKRLKQILINLVGNAVKFTKKGGVKIRVTYELVEQSSSIVPSAEKMVGENRSSNGYLRFRIADTGIGMTDEQRTKLFRPFVQGDASVSRHFGGTGLGLAISRRLANMLGGDITAASTFGKGSTFECTIATGSLSETEMVDPEPLKQPSTTPEPQTFDDPQLICKVLVVDDRRDIRFLSKRILTKAGASVDECEDGQLAVDFIREALDRAAPPDLILLDMQMPNLDGYQTAVALRSLGFAGPIIALTADAMQGDMNKCIEAGCNDYLSKPIDSSLLIGMVSKLTAR